MNNRVKYRESGEPATEEQVSKFENSLGTQLPLDYRAFLQQINGGQPEPSAFPLNDPRDPHGLISWFFTLEPKDGLNDLEGYVKSYRKRIPTELLPIASDPGGSMICLAISGEKQGAIFFWDLYDALPPGRTPDYHNIYFVAHSFDELLNSLSELPDDE